MSITMWYNTYDLTSLPAFVQADSATAKAADWVKTNSRDRLSLRENYVGDLAIDVSSAKPVELAH